MRAAFDVLEAGKKSAEAFPAAARGEFNQSAIVRFEALARKNLKKIRSDVIVYSRLAPNILERLKDLNPRLKNGYRKHKHINLSLLLLKYEMSMKLILSQPTRIC